MRIAFLHLPALGGTIRGRLVFSPSLAPIWGSRLREALSAHEVVSFPRSSDTRWLRDGVLLSPSFYTDVCRSRIEADPRHARGEEAWVLARILCEAAPQLIRSIRAEVAAGFDEARFGRSLLGVHAAWSRLEEILLRAFSGLPGEAGASSDAPGGGPRCGSSEATEALLRHLYPPGYWDDLAAFAPHLVVLVGDVPACLPLAVEHARRLRRDLPAVRLVLYQDDADIYTSMAQALPALIAGPWPLGPFDATTVFVDLQDLTLSQIVEKLASGRSSFAGIENLVCSEDGRIAYREPEPTSVAEYLEHTHLDHFESALTGRAWPSRTGAGNRAETGVDLPRVFPVVTVAKQTCYWDRCLFCPTSSQSWIRRDPFLERRAEEAATAVTKLAAGGAELTFLGREVVPPRVLHDVVALLGQLKNPPQWSYEGRFEPFYDQAFVEALARSGCRGVIFGLESPVDRLNRSMDKYGPRMSVARIEEIVGAMDATGISVHVNTIYDLPGSAAEDLEVHASWLARVFDGHRLFHFNTNTFSLLAGSQLAARPEQHGLQVDAAAAGNLAIRIPFRRAEEPVALVGASGRIWTRIFGSSWYDGCLLEGFHAIYHEATCCAFWDATKGRNLFKEIQAAIRPFVPSGALRLELAESVEIVESENGSGAGVWLVDLGGPAGWVRLPGLLWQIVSTTADCGCTLDAAIDEVVPDLADRQRQLVHETATRLLSRGLLISDRGSPLAPSGSRVREAD